MKLIAALLGAFLIYQLQKYLYRNFWSRKLTVDLTMSDNKAVEGEELVLYETIQNRKLLPIPVLKIKYTTSRYLSFLDLRDTEVTDNTYRNDLVSVMMYQKLTRSIPFVCSRRGYYTIDKMVLVCNDMLLESELVQGAELDLQLYVYPRQVAYDRFDIPFQKIIGTILTKRFINEDPFEFRSIREYQSYDTMKTINWKASAKTGSLMVNVYDHTASQEVKLLLNLESDTIWRYEELQEESIRLAATFAAHLTEQGIPVSVHTNGPDVISRELLKVPAGSGVNHLQTINETLARIDVGDNILPFVRTVQEELLSSVEDSYLLLISSYQRKDLQDLLENLLLQKVDFTWIIPINKEVKLAVGGNLLSHVIPWELEE